MHTSDTRFHGMVDGIYHIWLCIARVLRAWYVVCQYHAALPKICTGYMCTQNVRVYVYCVTKHNKREYAIRTVFPPIRTIHISLRFFLTTSKFIVYNLTYFSSIFISALLITLQHIYICVTINLETNEITDFLSEFFAITRVSINHIHLLQLSISIRRNIDIDSFSLSFIISLHPSLPPFFLSFISLLVTYHYYHLDCPTNALFASRYRNICL